MAQPHHDPQSFDHLAQLYDVASAIERRHSFFLENLPRRRGRVLDVGCGTGLLAQELARHFATVLAIDISAPMIAIARAKRSAQNIEYRVADASSAEIEGSFDAIVSHTAFHHVKDLAGTLTRLKALLAPHGRFLIVDLVDRTLLFGHKSYTGLILGACAALGFDVIRCGFRNAVTLWRFRVSRPWLEHLKSDRYLPIPEFRRCYGELLPGATITFHRYFAHVVWEAPDEKK
jgi:SAM-dependent methyltransferase